MRSCGTADGFRPDCWCDDCRAEKTARKRAWRAERSGGGMASVVVTLFTHPHWMANGACRGQTELFFTPAGEREERRTVRETAAKQLCAQCPVVELCRQWGRAHRKFGIWGGETEADRAAVGIRPDTSGARAVMPW